MSDTEPADARPEPSVRINLSTIYAEVVEQGKTNVSIEGKLDRVLSELHDGRATDTDHETRIRAIEASYVTRSSAAWWLVAAMGAVTAVTGVLALFYNR